MTSLSSLFWTFGSQNFFQRTTSWNDKTSGQSEELNPAPRADFEGIYGRLRWRGSQRHLSLHGPVLGDCWTWAPAVRWGNNNGREMWGRATGGGRGVLRDGQWAVTSFFSHAQRGEPNWVLSQRAWSSQTLINPPYDFKSLKLKYCCGSPLRGCIHVSTEAQ